MWNQRLSTVCFVIATWCLVTPSWAYAYIDPGTGSFIIQAIIGTLLAAGFFIRLAWARIHAFFRRLLFGGGKHEGETGGTG